MPGTRLLVPGYEVIRLTGYEGISAGARGNALYWLLVYKHIPAFIFYIAPYYCLRVYDVANTST